MSGPTGMPVSQGAKSNSEFAVYRALYDYTPTEQDIADGCLVVCCGDLLQVKRPFVVDSGTESKPGGWLRGRNLRTNVEGFFPCSEYVEYVVDKPIPGPRPKPNGGHKLSAVYFIKPLLCACCNDYIWGVGNVGCKCEGCGIVVHTACESHISSVVGQCTSVSSANASPQTFASEVPLTRWDVNSVAMWMAAVNLTPYIPAFRRHEIDGNAILSLNTDLLNEMGITEDFHKQAVMLAVNSLCCRNEVTHEQSSTNLQILSGVCSQSDHQFFEYSFPSMQHCHICGRPLLGIERQGKLCRSCGLCCHRQCVIQKLPACDINVTGGFHRLSLTNNFIGVSLNSSCNHELVTKCIIFLESLSSSGVNVTELYSQKCSHDELCRLEQLVSEGESIDTLCTKTTPVNVAGLIKLYLIEMPDPVIPEKLYDDFIDAANEGKTVYSLIGMLPTEHETLLRQIILHLRYVSRATEIREPASVDQLGVVFGKILLRPQWNTVVDNFESFECRHRVITMLLQSDIWSESGPTVQPAHESLSPGVPPPRPPRPAGASLIPWISSERQTMHYGRLEDALWYWGDIAKEAVNDLMNDQPDGAYLVRDAKGQAGQYTLTLRKGGSNKLIRIAFQDGHCGFSTPYKFASVVDLIYYYSTNSLAEYNSSLDIVLKYPIVRTDVSNEPALQDLDELRRKYRKKQQDYLKMSEDFDAISDLHSRIMQEIHNQNLALEAFNGTVEMFNEQLKLCDTNQSKVAPQDSAKLRENIETLKGRLTSFSEKREHLKREIRRQTDDSRRHVAKMNEMKPELKRLGREREQLKKQLLNQGESIVSLDQLLDSNQAVEVRAPPLPHHNEKLWLIKCDRDEAEQMLFGHEEGTFLIRPRNSPNSYALSIVKPPSSSPSSQGAIAHCIISWKDTGYGFASPYFIHRTLKDLVLHYREASLFEHNDYLDTTLRTPVGLFNISTGNSLIGAQSEPSYVPVTPRYSRRDD